MTAKQKHEYRLDRGNMPGRAKPPRIQGARVRADLAVNRSALAQLKLNAYRGSIDYDGETIDEARSEIDRYLDDRELRPLLDCSWLFFVKEQLVSACLVSWWPRRQCPVVGYLLTDPEWKNRGIASELLQEVVRSLVSQEFHELRAVITEGNIPLERLFVSAGFSKIASDTTRPLSDGAQDRSAMAAAVSASRI